MPTYARDTTVDSGASRAEIERTLKRFGCEAFGYMSDPTGAQIIFEIGGRRVKFVLPLPDPAADEFKYTVRKYKYTTSRVARSPEAARSAYEQAVRQRWRALALCIKAKLEAIESGIETADEAFMAHLILAGGRTMAEAVAPHLEEVIESGALTLSLPGHRGPLLLTG